MCKGDIKGAARVLSDSKIVVTRAELDKHNRSDDNWISIAGQVYDITQYVAEKHPGGQYLPMQVAGKDATPLFRSTHPKYAETLLKSSPLIKRKGVVCDPAPTHFKFESEFYDTCQSRVEAYFKETKQKPNYHPWGNFDNVAKTVAMMALWVMGWYFHAGWVWVIAQSVATQLFCFSAMHTNNHGAGAQAPWAKFGWDCIVDTCGGVSTIAWRHLHNVCHHFQTNLAEHDTDIQNAPWFRFSAAQPLRWWHRYQHIYASPLMIMFPALKMEFKHSYIAATLPNVHPVDRLRWFCGKMIYWTLFVILPAQWHGWQFALGAAYLRYMTCSFLYTHVIAPNHINEHCQNVTCKDWHAHQVYTSSNSAAGDLLTNWFTSGLSHQIEHHLFPMIHHFHYPALQPIIKATILEYNLPYTENRNLATAVWSYWSWLYKVGREHPAAASSKSQKSQ
eukprot:SAG22_NODE_2426_length_2585_cov_1.231295_1_plen_448_part_00